MTMTTSPLGTDKQRQGVEDENLFGQRIQERSPVEEVRVRALEELDDLSAARPETLRQRRASSHGLGGITGRQDVPFDTTDLVLAKLNTRTRDRIQVRQSLESGEVRKLDSLGTRLAYRKVPTDLVFLETGLGEAT